MQRRRRDDPWRPPSNRGKFVKYSDEYYEKMLRLRDKKIALALNHTRSLPRDLQERILSEAGLFDMPARGRYLEPIPPHQFYGY